MHTTRWEHAHNRVSASTEQTGSTLNGRGNSMLLNGPDGLEREWWDPERATLAGASWHPSDIQ